MCVTVFSDKVGSMALVSIELGVSKQQGAIQCTAINAKKNGYSKSVNLRYKTVLMSGQKGVVMQRSSGLLYDGFEGTETNKNV